MANTDPIALGGRRELFVDRLLLAEQKGANLRLHAPRSAGAAFRFDAPWEGSGSAYSTILQDGKSVRMYYRAWGDLSDHAKAYTAMAESNDGGRTFRRPNLGLIEVNGSRENNVILDCREDFYTHNFAPMVDPRPEVPPDQRYKALTRNYGFFCKDKRTDPMGLAAFASADGVSWRKLCDELVITKGAFDSQNVTFWSEHEDCFVCYLRVGQDGVRSIARAESPDYVNWSTPTPMNFGGAPPEHLYTNQTQPYFRAPHIYIAMPGRFMPGKQALTDAEAEALGFETHDGKPRWGDCSDAVFMTSRGGHRYDRTFMDSFVRPGRDPRNWGTRCNYPCCGVLQTSKDEMSFYIDRHNSLATKHVERLTMRLDGFSSLQAGYSGGEALTPLITFSGRRLTLNYATSAAGWIRVELQDDTGAPIKGFALADCQPMVGDRIDQPVTWVGGSDVGSLAARPVRMRFALQDADVFAFQFLG